MSEMMKELAKYTAELIKQGILEREPTPLTPTRITLNGQLTTNEKFSKPVKAS
jgi:hypothetical protein